MDYFISDKMRGLRPSAIREIFKHAGDPGVISFAAGDQAPESLPVESIRKILATMLDDNPSAALMYSQSEGHPPLRAALKEYAAAHGCFGEGDELIVTSGAQQCMDIICKTLCNEGDTIICEDPSFIGSLNCFRSYNVNLVGVPMQPDGIDIDRLETAIKANPNTRLLYLIPNFQNPTAITMSAEKRHAVYDIAKRYGLLILEDNPYGDLRFAGEHIPAIKSLDTHGIVIYAGSFSKILSTGMRVGYLIAPKELMSKIIVAKQCADVHTGMLGQLLCYRFLTEYDIAAHIQQIRKIYADKCTLMLSEIKEHFPAEVVGTTPQGGLFIWCEMPPGADGDAFATSLVRERKVCIVPGSAFAVNPGMHRNCFRMNFSMPPAEKISEGIRIAGDLLHEII